MSAQGRSAAVPKIKLAFSYSDPLTSRIQCNTYTRLFPQIARQYFFLFEMGVLLRVVLNLVLNNNIKEDLLSVCLVTGSPLKTRLFDIYYLRFKRKSKVILILQIVILCHLITNFKPIRIHENVSGVVEITSLSKETILVMVIQLRSRFLDKEQSNFHQWHWCK